MSFFNLKEIEYLIENQLIEKISNRLSNQLNIEKTILQNALKDEHFKCDLVKKYKEDYKVKSKEEKEIKSNVLDCEIVYDFMNDFEDHTNDLLFWKTKKIKIEDKSYHLHFKTKLVLFYKDDDSVHLVGLKSKDGELIEQDELPNFILEWCKRQNINV
jgi:hypothetical protein